MKKRIALAAATILCIGCMAMPVSAGVMGEYVPGEKVDRNVSYNMLCPSSGCGRMGKFLYQIEITTGYYMAYLQCPVHGLYHCYIS